MTYFSLINEQQHIVLSTSNTKYMTRDFRRTTSTFRGEQWESGGKKLTWSQCVKTWPSNTWFHQAFKQRPTKSLNRKHPQEVMANFYRSATESILTNCATVWYASCTATEHKNWHWSEKAILRIIGVELPHLDYIPLDWGRKPAASSGTTQNLGTPWTNHCH